MTTPARYAFVLFVALSGLAATPAFGEALERTTQSRGVIASVTPMNLTDVSAPTIDFKIAVKHSFLSPCP